MNNTEAKPADPLGYLIARKSKTIRSLKISSVVFFSGWFGGIMIDQLFRTQPGTELGTASLLAAPFIILSGIVLVLSLFEYFHIKYRLSKLQ